MQTLTLKSPAKLNLYLNVLRKRPDGYHEIETLFERISIFDDITLRKRKDGITLSSSDKTLPTDERNLAFKAAMLLKKKFNVKDGVSIYIRKRIPIGAGLGGGSSNGATVLKGLNSLWRLGLSKPQLMRLGKNLGADVPFFLMDTPMALGYGIGENLKPLPKLRRPLWHLVVNPGVFVSTKKAYKWADLALTRKKGGAKILASVLSRCLAVGGQEGSSLDRLLYNSLESAVLPAYKEIAVIKDKLKMLGARAVLMSGSGSTAFAVCENEKEAKALGGVFSRFKKRNWQVFVARTY